MDHLFRKTVKNDPVETGNSDPLITGIGDPVGLELLIHYDWNMQKAHSGTIDENGLYTATSMGVRGEGSESISALFKGQAGTRRIKLTDATLQALTLSDIGVNVNESSPIELMATLSQGEPLSLAKDVTVQWTYPEEYITIKNGKVTGKKATGTEVVEAIVQITVNGVTLESNPATITVD